MCEGGGLDGKGGGSGLDGKGGGSGYPPTDSTKIGSNVHVQTACFSVRVNH